MKKTIIATSVLLFAASSASAGLFDEESCAHSATRLLNLPLTGISRVVIDAGAGTLKVDGGGNGDLRARGVACASDEKTLQNIQLVAKKVGSDLHLDTKIPDQFGFGFFEAKMDLAVVLPANMALSIDDGSGSVTLTNVGPLHVEDGSGEMIVHTVNGSAEIEDGSGSLDIDGVKGDLRLEDGSGSISVANVSGNVKLAGDGSGSVTIRRVDGSVLIGEDGSGSVQIENVKRDVTIQDKGSGSVIVSDIGGNFTVHDKGSGGISYARVAGKVSIPRD